VLAEALDGPEQLQPLLANRRDPEQPVERCFQPGRIGGEGGVLEGSVKNLGRYAANWIAWWLNRPSSTAALT